MNNQDYVDFLNACIKECDDVWGERKKIMRECYDRYRSYRDFSKKKGWQHKIVAPTVYPAIKGASGLIQRILMKSDEFFKFVPERQDNAPQQADPMTGQPIEDNMDNFARAFTRKVRFHIDECGFIDKFGEAVESALACMLGVLKFTPKLVMDTRVIWGPIPFTDEEGKPVVGPSGEPYIKEFGFVQETAERAKLFCEVVNPLLLRFPLDASYFIEETRVPLWELLDNREGLEFNKRELNRLKREDYESAAFTEAEQNRLKMLQIKEHKNQFRKEVVLHTFYGTVTDRQGNVVFRDARFIVANQKYLITKPGPVPYWLRKHNYVLITPLKVLFQAIGAGMVDGIRPIINAIDNLVNIAGDKMLYAMIPPSEVNVDALSDPQQAEGGLVPGKLFKTKGPLGQALRQLQPGDIPPGGFSLIELFKMFIQNYTGWTEFMMGMPTRKGSVTATEVERKTEASSLSFENIAASIEKGGVIESVEIVRDFCVQYFMDPALNPETIDIFMQEKIDLMNLPEAERFAFVNKRYPIKVKGLTAFFDAEKDRKDLIDLVGVISQVPALAARLNLEEFLTRVINTFDWPNPEMLVLKGMAMIDPETGMALPPGQMYPSPLGGGAPGGTADPQMAQLIRSLTGGEIQ